MTEIQAQCWICPDCFDDKHHKPGDMHCLKGQIEHFQTRIAELESSQQSTPNENGKNRYGLDMSYFRDLFNRELSRPLVDFMPHELARVLARAARTADASVLQEREFQTVVQQGVPDWVFDGYAVFEHLSDKAQRRTSAENVSDTLDAIKALLSEPHQTH